jgi:hypothetical protein
VRSTDHEAPHYEVPHYEVFSTSLLHRPSEVQIFSSTPKFVGSNPAEAVRFFGRKNPQHAFLRRGRKGVSPMSQICGM